MHNAIALIKAIASLFYADVNNNASSRGKKFISEIGYQLSAGRIRAVSCEA